MPENWKPVPGFDGHYEVSSLGRVRSLPWPGHHKEAIIMKVFRQNSGYLVVTLHGGKKKLLHRLVAEAFIENPNGKTFVNHIDGNRLNNNIENLEWVTPRENCEHSISVLGNRPGKKPRMVKCIDNGKIYSSVKEVASAIGRKEITVYKQIENRKKCAGKLYAFCDE